MLALGTNEAANVAAGSNVGERERIDKMMTIIGDEPVLWVNVKSLVEAGDPYSAENMEKWDEELVAACAAYPNMRVYNWAADVKNDWFIEDGIHFTSPGYAARAQLIAQALAHAFPAKGEVQGRLEKLPRQLSARSRARRRSISTGSRSSAGSKPKMRP